MKTIYSLISMFSILLVCSCSSNEELEMIDANIEQRSEPQNNLPGPPQLLVSGLQGTSGSAVGPDGALYIPQGAIGKISRVDPDTGTVTDYVTGLPTSIPEIGLGGVIDVAFLDDVAYALVTLIGPQFVPGNTDVVGIYRIDGPSSYTVIADIGAFSIANTPTDFFTFVDRGVQFAIQSYKGGFLVTDGHHNRVLHVKLNGQINEFMTFGNIAPTGLALRGNKVYMAQTGPTPHLPEDGKVISFSSNSYTINNIASGSPLLVDVEFNRGRTLFALSQGIWDGVAPGSPAFPNTGKLLTVNEDGTLTEIVSGLDRPTSLEFINNKAFIITLTGEIWTVDNVARPPFGN